MSVSWNDRVVAPELREFVRRVQRVAPCRVAGGAALSGVHLGHRLSRDLDLFCDDRESVRAVLAATQEVVSATGGALRVVRDGGSFVRCDLTSGQHRLDIDVAYEPSIPLAPRDIIDGVVVDSLEDLRANKLTCLLSRSEPRDLVDLYFLDAAGFAPEAFLVAALEKDAGMDPGILSLLLRTFPLSPLPVMIKPLGEEALREFRNDLANRFRVTAMPEASE